jgi:transcriptional regulator with XRE-family HTH domain
MAVGLQLPRKKAPNPVDKHVGSRVRMRRIMLAMSQEKLGAALGLTFQQVQKYERGANRIGASRLQQMSHILQVPVEFFFEGAPNASAPHGSNESTVSMAYIDDFVSNSDGLRLIGAFMRIDNAALRRRIVMLVQEIGGEVERVEGATMDYTKLTLAELRNGISDTKSAIHRCKEALDNLRQPKTVGLQAMADAITHLLPRLEQDLKALEKAYIAKSVSRGQQ